MLLTPPITKDFIKKLYRLDAESMKYFWTEKQWTDFLELKSSRVIYSEFPRAALLFNLNEIDEVVHLLKIMVTPNSQRMGIGKKLLNEMIDLLHEEQKKSIFLEVEATNEQAISFYKKSGFVELRTIKQYYSDGSSALSMQLNLDEIAF